MNSLYQKVEIWIRERCLCLQCYSCLEFHWCWRFLVELKKRRKKKRQRALRKRRRRIIRSASSENKILSNALQSNSVKAYIEERQSQCRYRLYDHCAEPNCNLRCPTYMNLFSSGGSSGSWELNGSSQSDSNLNTDYSDIENSISDPVKREEIITTQRWLAQATCKQLFHAFYYGSLGKYIGLSRL